MANIVLQSQDLTNAASKIDSAADELREAIQRLDSLMANLDSVWNDANSKIYIQRYEELKREFPAFEQSVRNYGTFLNGVVSAYRREFMERVSTSVNNVSE